MAALIECAKCGFDGAVAVVGIPVGVGCLAHGCSSSSVLVDASAISTHAFIWRAPMTSAKVRSASWRYLRTRASSSFAH